ncbi:MAG: GGDEF domain-containing protein [Sedimentisphaerales bacterium]|nr:GGDEF domain-containing protein [Sedimentisphaerales bacterium]
MGVEKSKDLSGQVLLIGDIDRAFLDAARIRESRCEAHLNILDGIDAARNGDYSIVGVVMSGAASRLRQALKALRGSCLAKIILLAMMSEEPEAMALVGRGEIGSSVADDYFICPLEFSAFLSRAAGSGDSVSAVASSGEVAMTGLPDGAAAERMAHLERLATEDDLTGLKNRNYIWEFARQVIERAEQAGGRVTLLVFDIDNLKHYNDLYGHLAGDEILREAAVLIRRCCRSHDVVGRIGGDEFAVIFWDDPRQEGASEDSERRSTSGDHPGEAIFIVKRFVSELERAELHLLGSEGKGVLAISGGLASYPRDGASIEELFAKADMALLDAKQSGKNRVYLVGKDPGDIADID